MPWADQPMPLRRKYMRRRQQTPNSFNSERVDSNRLVRISQFPSSTLKPNNLTNCRRVLLYSRYVLIAFSEIFASITGLEYAFTKAPTSMRSLVMAVFLFTSAVASALGEAFVCKYTYSPSTSHFLPTFAIRIILTVFFSTYQHSRPIPYWHGIIARWQLYLEYPVSYSGSSCASWIRKKQDWMH
jgi:POT family